MARSGIEWRALAGLVATGASLWVIGNYLRAPDDFAVPPVPPCPAQQRFDLDLVKDVPARFVGSSTPWLVGESLKRDGRTKLSAAGVWGGTAAQIRESLPVLLGPDPAGLGFVFIYAGRIEAEETRGKAMTTDQIEATAALAYSSFVWTVNRARTLTGVRTRIVGLTLLPPPDRNENVTKFEGAYHWFLFQRNGGHEVLDLRGCDVELGDEIHPNSEGLQMIGDSIWWYMSQ